MTRDKIRNFSVIAHVDHGKTTLTDQFLSLTAQKKSGEVMVLDSNPIEKERGITIKLAPVRLNYQGYTLNLIDTPGHVDFSYEVSRSLAACEGVLLVVDATQGIQAQTLSHYHKAKELGLVVIPVINKIDLPSADVESVSLELMELCGVEEDEIIAVSAKTGKNVDQILTAVIKRIPPPKGRLQAPLRALLVTSYFDQHKGAIALIRVIDGQIKTGEKLRFLNANKSFNPVEVGVFVPKMQPTQSLSAGEVGYVATGLKDLKSLKIGDTLTTTDAFDQVKPLAGYQEPLPMVFMELYPTDAAEFNKFQDAIVKLALKDAALVYEGTHSQALGSGFKVGFLGILHAEVVLERLKREFDLELIATQPSVNYQFYLTNEEVIKVNNPAQMPDPAQIKLIKEPIAKVNIFTPETYLQPSLDLIRQRRGKLLATTNLGGQLKIEAEIPLAELITDFHDTLKSATSGFASLEYYLDHYQPAEVVKVDVLLNHEVIEALSFFAVKDQAQAKGRALVKKLKEVLPRQLFTVPIQAAIGGQIIARETLKPYRKDVTAKLYGGDVTRRKKLLAKQAKGKKRLKQFGKVRVDQDTFIKLLKT